LAITAPSRPVLAAFLVAALGACGGGGAFAGDGGAPEVQVGTGEFQFQPLAQDARVDVVCGPQGGQHIWVSVRARGLDTSRVAIRASIRLAGTSQSFCSLNLQDVPLARIGEWWEFAGMACFVHDPDLVRDQAAVLEGGVEDRGGRQGTAQVRIVPTGPPGSCAVR
jgi:hypothetical protein